MWDKGNSRPQKGRFRQQAEYIVWGSNGPMPVNRPVSCLPGVFRYGNPQNRIHVTEKPLQLMKDVIQICEPGGRILDPFAGAGTTIHPLSLHYTQYTLKAILVCTLLYAFGIGIYYANQKNYRRGEEHGSAKWGDAAQLCRKYQQKPYADNILLTQNFRMGFDCFRHNTI